MLRDLLEGFELVDTEPAEDVEVIPSSVTTAFREKWTALAVDDDDDGDDDYALTDEESEWCEVDSHDCSQLLLPSPLQLNPAQGDEHGELDGGATSLLIALRGAPASCSEHVAEEASQLAPEHSVTRINKVLQKQYREMAHRDDHIHERKQRDPTALRVAQETKTAVTTQDIIARSEFKVTARTGSTTKQDRTKTRSQALVHYGPHAHAREDWLLEEEAKRSWTGDVNAPTCRFNPSHKVPLRKLQEHEKRCPCNPDNKGSTPKQLMA